MTPPMIGPCGAGPGGLPTARQGSAPNRPGALPGRKGEGRHTVGSLYMALSGRADGADAKQSAYHAPARSQNRGTT